MRTELSQPQEGRERNKRIEYQRDKVSKGKTNGKVENARGIYKDILRVNSRNFGAVDEE
jgi:hypothetical protein